MKTVSLKLLTIIADEALRKRLVDDVKKLGAKGYTIEKAYGEGEHGGRMSAQEARTFACHCSSTQNWQTNFRETHARLLQQIQHYCVSLRCTSAMRQEILVTVRINHSKAQKPVLFCAGFIFNLCFIFHLKIVPLI